VRIIVLDRVTEKEVKPDSETKLTSMFVCPDHKASHVSRQSCVYLSRNMALSLHRFLPVHPSVSLKMMFVTEDLKVKMSQTINATPKIEVPRLVKVSSLLYFLRSRSD
jgi:hypothetical protein